MFIQFICLTRVVLQGAHFMRFYKPPFTHTMRSAAHITARITRHNSELLEKLKNIPRKMISQFCRRETIQNIKSQSRSVEKSMNLQ